MRCSVRTAQFCNQVKHFGRRQSSSKEAASDRQPLSTSTCSKPLYEVHRRPGTGGDLGSPARRTHHAKSSGRWLRCRPPRLLARADLLAACGMTVLISDYFEYYRLAAYISARTTERIGIVMGVPSLLELFDERYYTQFRAAYSRVSGDFSRTICAFTSIHFRGLMLTHCRLSTTSKLNRPAASLRVSGHARELCPVGQLLPRLFEHFQPGRPPEDLQGDTAWESMVPDAVADLIRQRSFFGYSLSRVED